MLTHSLLRHCSRKPSTGGTSNVTCSSSILEILHPKATVLSEILRATSSESHPGCPSSSHAYARS